MAERTFATQLDEFKQTYHALITIAEQYPPTLYNQEGVCGEWSAREVLAHINGWLVEAQRRYPRYARGTGNINYNVDSYNAVSLWLRENYPYEHILDETRQLTDKMITMARDIRDVHLERDTRYGEWLDILSEHVITHNQELQAFLDVNT
ncbi:MAG: hypothetical protein ACFE0Q_01770 [Anaerolineae bacterium]